MTKKSTELIHLVKADSAIVNEEAIALIKEVILTETDKTIEELSKQELVDFRDKVVVYFNKLQSDIYGRMRWDNRIKMSAILAVIDKEYYTKR